MKLPEQVTFDIIKNAIECFDMIIVSYGNFSSIEAEADTARIMEDTQNTFRNLMNNMRVNLDEEGEEVL